MTSNWFKDIVQNIENKPILTGNSIDTNAFINCFYTSYPFIYSLIGNENFVTEQLKHDIIQSFQKIGRCYEKEPHVNKTFDDIINNELTRKNNYLWACEADQQSPCVGVLWCYRAFSAFYTFIENLSWNEMTSKQCAKETYNNILKPYHKWSTILIANTVIQFIPERDLLFERVNIPPTTEGFQTIEKFLNTMHPIIERMKEIIDRHNINFKSVV